MLSDEGLGEGTSGTRVLSVKLAPPPLPKFKSVSVGTLFNFLFDFFVGEGSAVIEFSRLPKEVCEEVISDILPLASD